MLPRDHEDFDDFLAVVSREQAIDPGLVEKDYWIMHALGGLQQLSLHFELKGGMSLSEGHGLIRRFLKREGGAPIGSLRPPLELQASQVVIHALAAVA